MAVSALLCGYVGITIFLLCVIKKKIDIFCDGFLSYNIITLRAQSTVFQRQFDKIIIKSH